MVDSLSVPPSRSRNGNWVISSGGNVFYRIDGRAQPSVPALPAPLIGPRRTRPHAIHIITYPPGYVPRELRPKVPSRSQKAAQSLKARTLLGRVDYDGNNSQQSPVLGKLLASFASSSSRAVVEPRANPSAQPCDQQRAQQNRLSLPLPSALRRQEDDTTHHSSSTTSSSSSSAILGSEQPRPHTTERAFTAPPPFDMAHARAAAAVAAPAAPVAPPAAYRLGAATAATANRNSLMSVRSAKSAVGHLVSEVPKPVASGSGVSCSILLAEPNIFLSGFDHDHDPQRDSGGGTALLRGKLHLHVSKNVKIKAIQLKLLGRARTEWPEGIPPLKQDVVEEESLRTQVLTFFNAMNDGWETEYGNQCSYKLRLASTNSSTTNLAATPRPGGAAAAAAAAAGGGGGGGGGGGLTPAMAANRSGLTAKELKRLSLQSVQSRSFGKGDSGLASPTQAKGFKVFYPGSYDYSFELPIDHHQLETTKLPFGSVRWELHATVDRAGAFKPNLHGMKEVSIVRLPDQMSLETTEPISISRQWEDQLHYDIVISGKSFPIGSKIPIAFKLTPLAKVQVHKLKVYVTETIEYWTNDRRVTRKEPGRKILLLEKSAGKPLDAAWAASDITTIRGGEPSVEERRNARELAQRRRMVDAARRHRTPEQLPDPSANLLGDLDLGLESMWGSTEIEANVQIPTCEMMAKNKHQRLNPDCSWKNVNVYHWIKIVMRISRADPEDVTGHKRRHFEISIDSPFTVLNCRATQANTNLPAYSGPVSQPSPFQACCGCPDAPSVPTNMSPSSSTGTLLGAGGAAAAGGEALPTPPQAAYTGGAQPMMMMTMYPVATEVRPSTRASAEGSGSQSDARPIHLLRTPSFDPPAFTADIAPPPAIVIDDPDSSSSVTPPPQYDTVIGTPSVDGLADYFSRLADYGYHHHHHHQYDDDSGSDSDLMPSRILDRTGRVNVAHPRASRSGRRMPSRSMEIARPSVPLNIDNLPDPSRGAVM
ncbi:hypothetical protein L249_2453 [Ophiocordyceps polyrhachis-furcata BCC 54312]|uniref:Arrestin C-terminal-like domain-containing protein n=1 Tax=Ophiocordyceps polyrhachis-furcata BCC 54312 TaxID=1330021 RepID=A0A367LPK6_9HYPO|nr:hypothetical protein L249_2453 [Ophiocordyceps polyrhachis-furcata BCC 54312]